MNSGQALSLSKDGLAKKVFLVNRLTPSLLDRLNSHPSYVIPSGARILRPTPRFFVVPPQNDISRNLVYHLDRCFIEASVSYKGEG